MVIIISFLETTLVSISFTKKSSKQRLPVILKARVVSPAEIHFSIIFVTNMLQTVYHCHIWNNHPPYQYNLCSTTFWHQSYLSPPQPSSIHTNSLFSTIYIFQLYIMDVSLCLTILFCHNPTHWSPVDFINLYPLYLTLPAAIEIIPQHQPIKFARTFICSSLPSILSFLP